MMILQFIEDHHFDALDLTVIEQVLLVILIIECILELEQQNLLERICQ